MAVIRSNAHIATSTPAPDSDRLWLDFLPQPRGKTTLLGDMVRNLDYVRDKVTVRVFGGRDVVVLFDDRTHFYRDGVAASARELQSGSRVYVDTSMAGSDIFARNIRILSQAAIGESNGQIESYDPKSGELLVRDVLAAEPTKFHLEPNASVLRDGHPGKNADLHPGTLVSLKFGPSAKGPGAVREITILAEPGGQFVFAGRLLIWTCTVVCWWWPMHGIQRATTFTSIPQWVESKTTTRRRRGYRNHELRWRELCRQVHRGEPGPRTLMCSEACSCAGDSPAGT